VGAGSCGLAAGAAEVIGALEAYVKRQKDVDVVRSMHRPCYLEPLVDIQMPANRAFSYSNVTADNVTRLLQSFLEKGEVYKPRLVGHFGTEPFDARRPNFSNTPCSLRRCALSCGKLRHD